ncbi:MAG: zinc ribbon domain-containing protein [Gemmatimonadota bacterium]|nr:MAG: zinc ribbon domain-containing protein [Gemmatimonadota bacterium]
MDDLDRLYFAMVETLRREKPSALREPLRVLELHERLIPYRRVRNRVGFVSNDDYEIALTRLLSGERNYIEGDRDMQAELSAGLAEILPDTRRYLAFPETRVRLNPREIPPPGDTRYAPPEVQEAARRPEENAGTQVDSATGRPDKQAEEEEGPAVVDSAEVALVESGAAAVDESVARGSREHFDDCPRCKGQLPDRADYCPHCGCGLQPESCLVCGAELEATWSYCARCGSRRGEAAGESA